MSKTSYSHEFKRLAMLKLLSQPDTSVRGIARELGVGKSTIWDWKREVGKVTGIMAFPNASKKTERSAKEKLALVLEAIQLDETALGPFLREHGILEGDLERWQAEMLQGLSHAQPSQTVKRSKKDARRIRKLEKALAETAALLALQKKARLIWGEDEDEDDDSDLSNE